ncbi:MAG: DNA-processing protein DprA [Pseudomonadota bacterium]
MAFPERQEERDLFFWLALCLAPGVGAVLFSRLLENFKTPEAVFQASIQELSRVPRLPQKTALALTRFDWGLKVEGEIKKVRDRGCRLVRLCDAEYPPRLKQISDPPGVLWVEGELKEEDHTAVAIVGSRTPTDFGRRMSARLAGDLASAGVTVVSGMALGIDAAAHSGALAARGRTIGVLGCGLDVVYPPPNRDLYRKVPGSGALISEFPMGTQPEAGHFPQRNRIIAGLCVAVVVVEAGEKSGALITARLALDENREVFAVPGLAGSARSQGTHMLLKQGARLVETAADILEEVSPQLEKHLKPPRIEPEPEEMSRVELLVWEALSEDPVHLDVLGRKVGWTPSQMAPVLLNMELRGLIRRLPGNLYAKVN